MSVVRNQLKALYSSVTDADPAGGVGRMMHCSWFGELTLAFPQPDSIRIPLVPSDDKTSLTGTPKLVLNVIVIMSSRQHRIIY